MTSIDATVIPEPYLAEEILEAYISNGETYDSSLSVPKIVFITPMTNNTTVIPSVSISSRQITFNLRTASTVGAVDSPTDGTYQNAVKYAVLIKGRR